jgi:hypothetical protein
MSDVSLTAPADKFTPIMSTAQADDAVATAILKEVYQGMTNTTDQIESWLLDRANTDVGRLQGDPDGPGVIADLAAKIENHDPVLGNLEASVNRGKNGSITGFSFSNPTEISAYNQLINADVTNGLTITEAKEYEATNLDPAAIQVKQGVAHISVQ